MQLMHLRVLSTFSMTQLGLELAIKQRSKNDYSTDVSKIIICCSHFLISSENVSINDIFVFWMTVSTLMVSLRCIIILL